MSSHSLVAPMLMACAIALTACSRQESEPPTTGQDPAASPSASPPPATTATPGDSAAGAAPQAAADAGAPSGAQVYQTYCVTCHGAKGAGDGPAAAGLNPKPASFATSGFRLDANGNGQPGEVEDIKAVARNGAAKYGGSPLMAPWAMLSEQQLTAVAEHVKSLGSG